MSQEIMVPAHIKALVETGQKSSAALITSAGGAVPRISLKGRQFRFIKDGEEVAKTPGPIKLVIIGVQPESGMAKTFYKDGYNPGDTSPPDCSSTDGIRPDSWVSSPVSPTCANCPNNKWGSATSLAGKKSKACHDSKRLYVTKASDPVEGIPYILNVTVSSLKALSEYGKLLVNNGIPLALAVTKVTMDEEADFPKIQFEYAEALAEDLCVPTLERAAKKEWEEGTTSSAPAESQPDNTVVAEQPAQSEAAPTQEVVDQKVQANADNILDDWG